jgi:Flp pilus assembly protein protease CpaA
MRFKLLAAVYLLLLICLSSDMAPRDVSDVFIALASLLVFAVIALWPNSSRADRVDRAMTGESWADRIEFEKR